MWSKLLFKKCFLQSKFQLHYRKVGAPLRLWLRSTIGQVDRAEPVREAFQ